MRDLHLLDLLALAAGAEGKMNAVSCARTQGQMIEEVMTKRVRDMMDFSILVEVHVFEVWVHSH